MACRVATLPLQHGYNEKKPRSGIRSGAFRFTKNLYSRLRYESSPTAQTDSQALSKVRLSATTGNSEGISLTATADAGIVVRLSAATDGRVSLTTAAGDGPDGLTAATNDGPGLTATAVNDVSHNIHLQFGYCLSIR
jgi:hypothetical protein